MIILEIKELEIEGVFLIELPIFSDNRGYFREWFKSSLISESLGRNFDVRQANISSSNKGVLRGIHYSLSETGQGKWLTCISGAIMDVIVDIRVSSPTFKKHVSIELNSTNAASIFIPEELGHAFMALEDNSTVVYLLTSEYIPSQEFEINPLDQELDIAWPIDLPFLSNKDAAAPTLSQQLLAGRLPS